jgi:hypothetical protein
MTAASRDAPVVGREPPSPPAQGRAATVAAAPEPAPPGLLAHVAELQDDLRVLIRYVAGRPDKPAAQAPLTMVPATRLVAGDPAASGAPVSLVPAGLDLHAGLLVLAPEDIARDGALLERLYAAVDALTRLAAPADVASIRLTRAFVRPGEAEGCAPAVRAQARRLRRWAWASAAFGLLVFLVAVALLVHVDRGRRAVQQLELVRAEGQATARAAADTDRATPRGDAPASASPRLGVVRRELTVWNTISERLAYASPVTWLAPAPTPVEGLPEELWRSTELRTAIMMAALTGFVLPMVLGLLGACVYVYRELDAQIEACTLQAREGLHGTLRMMLGAILGGLLGALWTNNQAIQMEGVTLSLGALAFFVGFSVEVVFRLVDAMVRGVADRIGTRKS